MLERQPVDRRRCTLRTVAAGRGEGDGEREGGDRRAGGATPHSCSLSASRFAIGQAPSVQFEMTVAVTSARGSWSERNETPAS